jgi:phosphohistidine phosphatase
MSLQLYIIRHAKSSWSFQQLDDFSRPLGKRGRRDVRLMGEVLAKELDQPDLMISSPASRAFYTALHLADAWKYAEENILLEPALYHAEVEEILEIIKGSAKGRRMAIFGHNPGFTELAQELSGQYLDNLPTCACMHLTFGFESWEEIGEEPAKSSQVFSPKMKDPFKTR